MITIKVTAGPVQLGAGEVLRLSPEQFAPRAHNVDVVQRRKDGVIDVRAKQPLDFKTGEVFGVAAIPKVIADRVVDLDAEAKAAADEAARKTTGGGA